VPKIAEPAPKMADVTAAHRKSVASKSASAKAASSPAKTAVTTRERCRSTRRHHCRAEGKWCRKCNHRLRKESLLVSKPMQRPRMRSRNAPFISWAVRNLYYLLILVLNQPPLPTFRGSAVAEHEDTMTYFVRQL
jgi:hypothetical protein